jgi:hypothetical protein
VAYPVGRPQTQAILSLLVSNVYSPARRYAIFRLAANALALSGRFVFSAHHHTLVSRFRRAPQAGRYHDSGIFRYLFRRRELFEETQKYLRGVQCCPIQIPLPFADRLGLPLVALSRTAESIPLANQLDIDCSLPPLNLVKPLRTRTPNSSNFTSRQVECVASVSAGRNVIRFGIRYYDFGEIPGKNVKTAYRRLFQRSGGQGSL